MKDSERALRLVLDAWREAPTTVYHLVGNHELYNFNREEAKKLIPNICALADTTRPTRSESLGTGASSQSVAGGSLSWSLGLSKKQRHFTKFL